MCFGILGLVQISYAQEAEVDQEEVYNDDVTMLEVSVDRLFLLDNFKNNLGKNLTGISLSLLNQREAEGYTFFGLNINYAKLGSLSATVNDSFGSFDDDTGSSYVSVLLSIGIYLPFYYKVIEPYLK